MLKILAMLFMVIDHTALALFPEYSNLYLIGRLIGRLAMPIFAYKIACGFIYTSNLKRYASKIFIMTLAAQIPFILLGTGNRFSYVFKDTNGLFLINHWNIGLTFLCALGILYLLTTFTKENFITHFGLLLILSIAATSADYGLYGVCMVLFFYAFIKHKTSLSTSMLYLALLTTIYYILTTPGAAMYMLKMQLPAIFALPIIHYIPDSKTKLPKNFFYIFYPLHMLLISILTYYIK